MDVHVLNGDALALKHKFDGLVVVCRECLIDGPVEAENIGQFWQQRADFIYTQFEADSADYFTRVKAEFEKLHQVTPDDNIYLWFEHDLFCQVNMWFVIHLLTSIDTKNNLFFVAPPIDDNWRGFGNKSSDDFARYFRSRVKISYQDQQLARQLWQAYRTDNGEELAKLGQRESKAFPLLQEVCNAHLERIKPDNKGRPYERLRQIVSAGTTNFSEIFRQFSNTEGIYGFGDDQVKTMLNVFNIPGNSSFRG